MNLKISLFLIFFNIIITSGQKTSKSVKIENNLDTFSMVDELRKLRSEGDPRNYYHWNAQLAAIYQSQISKVAPEEKLNFWYKYCQQLLKSGENQKCIDEIENLISRQNLSYHGFLSKRKER